MGTQITVLGVRHHGPGSARMLVRAFERLDPDAVLIEGPPDAQDVLMLAGHKAMKPPVALLVYEPERPSEAAYYPFATFSPEWQSIRWGLERQREVRFIDLPRSLRTPADESEALTAAPPTEPHDSIDDAPSEDPSSPNAVSRDPLDQLAKSAGFSDGEAWWGRLIEEYRGASGEDNPIEMFDSIREAMAAARAELGDLRRDPGEPSREAHMRRAIRTAVKEGFERIAVVCGAWHAPVLSADALGQFSAKADNELIKGLSKRKTAATWIPWTYDRLALDSGYGAGIASPGWYEHLWVHHDKLAERWLTKVARLMRKGDLDASPASVIESVRLAESLAALRGRSIAGLDELGEATLSILCHGNPMPMRMIERKLLVGTKLGEVPDDVPTVPLQRDLAALQKSLRMKVSADSEILDLDQRKQMDIARSHLLHRLSILNIPWGTLEDDQAQRKSTFHEVWKLEWKPEFAVAIMEAARWGNTVEEAAGAFVADQAKSAGTLQDLTQLLRHVMLAELPGAIQTLVRRIQELSALAADVGNLMDALTPLAQVLRYGNVRKTDTSLIEPMVLGLFARICAGLRPACGSLDDDAAALMRLRIDAAQVALSNLSRDDLLGAWRVELRKVGDDDIHGLVAGRAWRHLLDSGSSPEEAATRLSLALSRGNDPAKASAWLEGFLGGSGMVLVHDARLLGIVDEWVTSLPRDVFEQVCPIARRTFATFEKPERRQIGEKIARHGQLGASAAATIADYDAPRGSLVEPVLRLILGEEYP